MSYSSNQGAKFFGLTSEHADYELKFTFLDDGESGLMPIHEQVLDAVAKLIERECGFSRPPHPALVAEEVVDQVPAVWAKTHKGGGAESVPAAGG